MAKAWSERAVFYLIDEVKQVPYIWDVKSPMYKNKFKKVRFWEELALKINSEFCPEVPFDPADICKKWNNLKTYFNSEHMKAIKAKKSGESAERLENMSTFWKYSQSMEFLIPSNEATPSVNNFNKKSLDELYTDIEILTDHDDLNDSIIESEVELELSQLTSTSSSNCGIKSANTSRKKRKMDEDNLKEICDSSNKLVEVLTKKLSTDVPNVAFGTFVVNEINNLLKEKQLLAKSKITQILFDLQKED